VRGVELPAVRLIGFVRNLPPAKCDGGPFAGPNIVTAVKYILVIYSIGLFAANVFDLITADQGLYGAVGVVILFGILLLRRK
jgi:hypothetical protein